MQNIEVHYGLDLTDFFQGMEQAGNKLVAFEERINESSKRNPMAGFAKGQQQFNSALGEQIRTYQKVQGAETAIFNERKRLEAQLVSLKSRQMEFIAAGKYSQLQADIKQTEARLKEVNNTLADAPKKAEGLANGFDKVGKAIKTAFTVTGILYVIEKVVEIGKVLIEVTGTGEKYQNQFTRIFEGNADAASGYLSTLQNVADTTNFTFDTLADNAAKLASRGIIPTKNELLGLGDTANFIGKDFEQLNEAILDANNSERWKELGFVVKTQGDKMTLSYGDFTTTVENSVKGAYSAIQAFSQQGKVLGSTAEAGQTLSGQMSTLGDTFAGLFRTIGNGNKGVLNATIDLITQLIQGGINLYKTLSPAIDAVGGAFVSVGKAIGSVFTSFSNFDTAAEKSATISQKFGFYISKYIVGPLVAFTLIVAGVVEGFNALVLESQYAIAKLTGKDSVANALNKQLAESAKRQKQIVDDFKKNAASMRKTQADYVKEDNQANRRADRRSRLNEEALANFKPTPSGTPKKAELGKAAIKAAADEYNLLLDGRKKYQEELDKLVAQYGKEQLESLDKNSVEYITRKAQLDRDEIKAEQDHLTELYRIKEAKSTRINPLTKKREAVIDPTLQLPEKTRQIYTNRGNAVTAEETKRLEELRYQNGLRILQITRQFDALEVEEVRKKWDDIIKAEQLGFTGNEAEKKKLEAKRRAEQKADIERVNISQAINQLRRQEELSLAFVDSKEVDRDLKQQKYNRDETLNIEKEKEKMRLKIRIQSGEKLIAYLVAQGEKENALLIRNTKNAVAIAQKQLEEIEKTTLDFSSGAGFFGSLLGLEGEDLDKFKKSADAIQASIQQVTQAQIEASEQRIAAIDAEISAKEEQIDIEEERNKEGFANNLSLRKAELENLKAQKAQEEAVRRRAVKTQQELDLISSTSSNIATTADLIASAAKEFKNYSGIPFVGIALAIASVAAIYSTIASFKAKARSISQLKDGGRIPLSGRTHSQGGHRIEGTDIEVERGEHVTKATMSEKYDDVLTAINQDNPHKALQALMKQHSFGLPSVIVQQIMQPSFGQQGQSLDTSKMERELVAMSSEIRELKQHMKGQKQYISLGNGTYVEVDGHKKTIQKP